MCGRDPAPSVRCHQARLRSDLADNGARETYLRAALEIDAPADRKAAFARLTEMMDAIATVWAATETPAPIPATEDKPKRRRKAVAAA